MEYRFSLISAIKNKNENNLKYFDPNEVNHKYQPNAANNSSEGYTNKKCLHPSCKVEWLYTAYTIGNKNENKRINSSRNGKS